MKAQAASETGAEMGFSIPGAVMELHGDKRTGRASIHPWRRASFRVPWRNGVSYQVPHRSRVSFRVPGRSRVPFYPLYITDAAEDKCCAGGSGAHAP